jgi:hypothetical protein
MILPKKKNSPPEIDSKLKEIYETPEKKFKIMILEKFNMQEVIDN